MTHFSSFVKKKKSLHMLIASISLLGEN